MTADTLSLHTSPLAHTLYSFTTMMTTKILLQQMGYIQDTQEKRLQRRLINVRCYAHVVTQRSTLKKIKYVKDRPGHDSRYALNSNKIYEKLSWKSSTKINIGLEKTFLWYLNNNNYFNSIKKNQILMRLGKV